MNRREPKFNLRALLREPLLHFVLIGAAIFILYQTMGRSPASGLGRPALPRITVNDTKLRELMVKFEQTQGRVPTRAELSKQVDDWVREEVLCQSALAAGVDRNDPVVRERLVNLMQWYLTGESANGEPGQDALRRYYEDDQPGATNTLLFEQIFFNPAVRDSVLMDARQTLDLLQAGKLTGTNAVTAPGDPLVAGGEKAAEKLQQGRADELATSFGMAFISQVRRMPLDVWSGPVQSSKGWHLVKHLLSENPTAAEKRMQRRRQAGLNQTAPDLTYEDLRQRFAIEASPFPAEVQK